MVGTRKAIEGELVQYETPNWLPLALIAGIDLVEDFMWMHELELADGSRVHAYKHVDTRRYLHLDDQLNAYVYAEGGRYEPIELAPALHGALSVLWLDAVGCASGAVERARRAIDIVHGREEGADRLPRR